MRIGELEDLSQCFCLIIFLPNHVPSRMPFLPQWLLRSFGWMARKALPG